MPINWLLDRLRVRKRGDTAISAGKKLIAPGAPVAGLDAEQGATNTARWDSHLPPVVVDSLNSFFRVINESVDLAANTKNPETFASRLEVAEDKLKGVTALAEPYGAQIRGVEDARASIDALRRRGPASVAKSARPIRRKPKVTATFVSCPPPETRVPTALSLSPWLMRTANDQGQQAQKFWEQMRHDLRHGEFWADRAKSLKDRPDERLRLAMENLPLPGAFKDAAVATRAIARSLKKEGQSINHALSFLYWLAAIFSFYVPYSKRLGQPGYNVMEAAPGGLIASLPFSYLHLGLDSLSLLTATDRSAMAATWGVPVTHTTLHLLHQEVWRQLENGAKLVHERRLDEILGQI